MITEIKFESTENNELIDLTERVVEIIQESGVEEGVCFVYSPHTTAGVTVTSGADEGTLTDILTEMEKIVPIRVNFQHTVDTPADAAGHIKVVLIGNSVQLPIIAGKLQKSHSQSVLFFEFDGPRDRKALVQIIPG